MQYLLVSSTDINCSYLLKCFSFGIILVSSKLFLLFILKVSGFHIVCSPQMSPIFGCVITVSRRSLGTVAIVVGDLAAPHHQGTTGVRVWTDRVP